MSRKYSFEVAPGDDEVPRAVTELHRLWMEDGGELRALTALFRDDQTRILRPHLQCWCDGRQLSDEEFEELNTATTTGRMQASWQPGRPIAMESTGAVVEDRRDRGRN